MAKVAIHPAVDNGVHIHAHAGFKGGTLVCKCKTDPVEVTVDSDYLFNHLCGCTQCWKPEGAAFSMLAAVPREKVKVTKNGQKLKIVDETKLLHRYACKDCGVHMYGVIEKADHVFHPFAFIHPERSRDEGYAAPTFAAFVSSAIEGGVPPTDMAWLRARLKELGIEPYDCYSPELMDIVASHAAKAKGTLAA
ncbi:MAG TPA: S-(hydroxymethyl)glutathione synthase [Rhodanobacteraceae bacterium]|jgi:S-(hydroxymethyl)glutathione synthase|nr:S-(hydroxymethyl)glutathione synthase [Rhodanobacteraceae bacterium]